MPWHFENYTTGRKEEGAGVLELDKFSFVKVKGAGLRAHMDKPELMTSMLKEWIGNKDGQLKVDRSRSSH